MRFCLIVFSIIIIVHVTLPIPVVAVLKHFSDHKVCVGTSGSMSVPANKTTHVLALLERYSGCTHVDGNLEITWLDDPHIDLSFLHNIVEVTGYVLISYVNVERLTLPALQIIRGRTPFRLNVYREEFALLVIRSPIVHLEFPQLREIVFGSVGLFNNDRLCHVRTIQWADILSGERARAILIDNTTAAAATVPTNCSTCSHKCGRQGGCWGAGPHQCQRLNKITCSPQCADGRCFGPGPRQCCHLYCAGGCTGPARSHCFACRHFDDNGTCTNSCPSMTRYNPVTYAWEPNPRGKYAYGSSCVAQCPTHLLTDSSACVRACPSGKVASGGACVPCVGPCPRTCRLRVHETLHSGNLFRLRDCTVLQGSLRIVDHTFSGYQEMYRNMSFGPWHREMHPSQLDLLRTLRVITGYVYVDAHHAALTSLDFLRHVHTIGGRFRYENTYTVYVAKTSLISLGLRSLRTISAGSVYIVQNARLCYVHSVDWRRFMPPDVVNRTDSRTGSLLITIQNNSQQSQCERRGEVCDPECNENGCWNAGSDNCIDCKHFTVATGKCVNHCNPELGMFQITNRTCGYCDSECEDGCTGVGPRRCVRCLHVRDGPLCLAQCPPMKFADHTHAICRPCHANCLLGCHGPKSVINATDGCLACSNIVVNSSVGSPVRCISSRDPVPLGHYRDPHTFSAIPPDQVRMSVTVWRPCHPLCANCSAFGAHTDVCHHCRHYVMHKQCVRACPVDRGYYAQAANCLRCSALCRTCQHSADNCLSCTNYRLYSRNESGARREQEGADGRFTCVSSCPSHAPYTALAANTDSYCTADAALASHGASPPVVRMSSAQITLLSVLLAVSLLLFTVVLLVCRLRSDYRRQALVRMAMLMSGQSEAALQEPVKPSGVRANVLPLRLVRETELRVAGLLGCGAFGTVYKGVLLPERDASRQCRDGVKLPVAIKVIRDDGDPEAGRSLMDEAAVMASLDHPHLLRLLGVCVASRLMLVTQLMPLGSLLSYVSERRHGLAPFSGQCLLNWCVQIARGMQYLESRRLVHRDLAARNVLLQNINLVKITDFGLAKALDRDKCAYRAQGGRMPVRWLALECIKYRTFTHKTDVWAFGVTIWELLTFGERPYENIAARDLGDVLETGKRLPQPPSSSIELYLLLVRCWLCVPESRPTFHQLVADLTRMAQDPQRYVQLDPCETRHEDPDMYKIASHNDEYVDHKYKSLSLDGSIFCEQTAATTLSTATQPHISDTALISLSAEREEYDWAPTTCACYHTPPSACGGDDTQCPLAVDEDNYLMPSCLGSLHTLCPGEHSGRLGATVSRSACSSRHLDNPEYHWGARQRLISASCPLVCVDCTARANTSSSRHVHHCCSCCTGQRQSPAFTPCRQCGSLAAGTVSAQLSTVSHTPRSPQPVCCDTDNRIFIGDETRV